MRIPTAIMVALLVSGCGERADELTPYVKQFEAMGKYHETLARYDGYLNNPALERQARDVRKVIQSYRTDMEGLDSTKDKFIRATHNNVKRALDRSLKKLVEPDFPTFTVSAKKQITIIREAVENHLGNLERLWEKAGKTEPFPLKWSGSD